MKKRAILFALVLSLLFLPSSFGLTINELKLNATTSTNYTSDDLYAYLNASTSSGQINFTGYWYRNNTRYLPIKYQNSLNYEGRDYASDLVKDSEGNLIASSYADNAIITKFNSTGSVLWNTSISGSYQNFPLETDSEDNIYGLIYKSTEAEIIITKFNSTGSNVLNITYSMPDYANSIYGLELDSGNNFYFSYLNSSYEVKIVSLDSSGNELWVADYPSSSNAYFQGSMTLDSQNSSYVATKESDGFLLVKINSTGSQLWNTTYSITNSGTLRPGALSVDSSNSVYLSGGTYNGNNTVTKYNSTGSQIWNLTYAHSSKADSIYSSIIDSNNNLYVTGRANYQPYTGIIGIDKINTTSGTLLWNSTVSLGPATHSAEGSGIALGNNVIYLWSYMPGTYYGFGIENVTFLVLEENFIANSTSNNQILGSTINNSNTEINETWKFCAYAVNQSNFRSSESCSNELRIFYPYLTIGSCQTLNLRATYTLNQSVNSSGTCFNIAENNLTLDGSGFLINYSQSAIGYGVNVSGYNNITIKNAIIEEGGTSGFSHGILFVSSNNSLIENNTISVQETLSNGILLQTQSTYNNISNNVLSVNGDNGIGIYSFFSANNIIFGNNVTTNATSSRAIYSSNAGNNTISYNSIFVHASSSGGVSFSGSESNLFSYNNITTIGTSSRGLLLTGNAHYNSIDYNSINSTQSAAISLSGVLGTNLSQNTLSNNPSLELSTEGSNYTLLKNQPIEEYEIENIGSIISIENTTYGKIDFTSIINGSGINLVGSSDSEIIFGNNSIQIDSAENLGLNKSANLTLYGIGDRGFSDIVIIKDNSLCEECYNFTSLTANTVIFNISSSGTYSIGERPTSTEEESQEESSGGGGYPTFKITEESLEETYTKKLYKNWQVSIEFEEKTILFEIKETSSTKAYVIISYEDKEIKLYLNSVQKIDLNNDGFYDLSIELTELEKRINNPGATIEFNKIKEKYTTEIIPSVEKSKADFFPLIIIGIVLVLSIVILKFTGIRKFLKTLTFK